MNRTVVFGDIPCWDELLVAPQERAMVLSPATTVSFQDGFRTHASRICDHFVEINPPVNPVLRSATNNYLLEHTLLKSR